MKTRSIRIGNSYGVLIPQVYFQQVGLGDEVEIEVRNRETIIRSVKQPRQGWSEAFQATAENGDDALDREC